MNDGFFRLSDPYIGQVYFHDGDGQTLRVWNGHEWIIMTPPNAAATVFKPTIEQIELLRDDLIAMRMELG